MKRFLSIVSAGLVSVMLVACGGGGGSSASTGSGGAVDPNAFAIASTVVTNGGTLPLEYACKVDGGQEIPPSFYWKNPPANTGSYVLSVEITGEGDRTFPGVAYFSISNIDGSVLSTPASFDLTGLGTNAVINAAWDYAHRRIACRHTDVFVNPPHQHYHVIIVALSKDMPKPIPAGYFERIDTVKDSTAFGGVAPGLLDGTITYTDPNTGTQTKHVSDYVVGQASMTFDY